MPALPPKHPFLRITFLTLVLGGLSEPGLLLAAVQGDSEELEYVAPDYIEYNRHVKTDYYYGFNEFVRSPDAPAPALPKPPKKFATLTWAGFVTESNTIDWIGSSKTVFSGAATWTGDAFVNGLTKVSFLNASASDPGDGSNGPYTVEGFPGGGCGELHHLVNVHKTEVGQPGALFINPDTGSPAPTQLLRTYAGALNWHWNDLHAPCNLMDFDFGSDVFPVRGPVTETLSTEVIDPGKTDETHDAWSLRQSNVVVEASNSWRYESFESWTSGSQAPLLVQENRREIRAHFPATACDIGEHPKIVLIVSTRTGSDAFVKYAVEVEARVEKSPDGSSLVTAEIRALPVEAIAGKTIMGIQAGKFADGNGQTDFARVVRLETVRLKPDSGDCSTVCQAVHSIDWSMGLGLLPNGDFAGALNLQTESFSAQVFTPAGLAFVPQSYVNSDLGTVYRPDGSLRQIRTGNRLFDLITPTDDPTLPVNSYEVRSYLQAGSTPAAGTTGLLVPAGAPLERTRFSDPAGDGTRLRIERFTAGTQSFSTVEYAYASATNTWSLTEQGTRRIDRVSVNTSATVKTVTTSVWDLTGASERLLSKVREKIESLTASGLTIRAVTERTLDPDGAALTSQWQYGPGLDGQLLMTGYQSHTGFFTSYYNGTSYYQFFNRRASAVTTPFGLNRQETVVEMVFPSTYTMGFLRINYLTGLKESTNYSPGNGFTTISHSKDRGDAAHTSLSEIFRRIDTGPFAGRMTYHKDFAGVLTLTTYALDPVTKRTTTTVSTGAANGANDAVVDGVRTVTITNPDGELVSAESTDIASGLMLDQQVVLDRDAHGRATVISLFDGSLEDRSYNICCGLLESVTRHGITTSYVYDALRRKTSETTAGVTLAYTYDALDRVIKTRRIGSDASEVVLSTADYDVAGRLIATTDARGGTTTYSEIYNADGTTTRTTTAPDLSTTIETTSRSGQLLSRSGTGVAPVSVTYVDQSFGFDTPLILTTVSKAQPEATATEWTRTGTDAFGHDIVVEYSDGAKQTAQYNTKDQLVKQVDPDGVTTLFAYNARGDLQDRAVDLNRNGIIDYTGTDRIVRSVRDVATAHGATVHRTTTSVWAADGADTPTVASLTESSADGRQTWQTADGLTTHAAITYGTGASRTETVTDPDGTVTTRSFASDRLLSLVTAHLSLGSLSSATYSYDPHGRVVAATDARTGATTYTYFNDGTVHTVTTPDPDATRSGDGYDPQVTTYAYDNMGRVTTVTQPDGGVVHTTYYPTGATKRTWGSRTYPSEYTYDEQGRVKTLTTWQDFTGDAGKAVTTWNYDSKRGWLTDKQDAAGKGAAYRYTPAGRLSSLQRARDSLLRPLLYGYDAAGNLTSVVYPDDTPSTSLTYDRLGRLFRRTDASGTCTYSYSGVTGLLATETYDSGLLAGLSVNRTFDSLDRLSGVSALNSQPSTLNSVTYGYDAASRLDTVTSGPNTATYGYLANSPLVDSITFKQGPDTRLTTTKAYDNLNRLGSITNTPSASSALSAFYQYNNANQRTKATRENNAYWNYGYDALGQVTSGKKFTAADTAIPGHDFAWTYDDIGNRKTDNRNAQLTTYTSTLLNTYSTRTVPGITELLGTADPAATITVNNAPVARQDSLFYGQLPVDNSSAAQYSSLNVKGVNAGVTVNELRHALLAKTPEVFTHDADGNQTDNARWHYTWDADNRLIEMQTSAPAATAGVPKVRLVFTYDALGRRVAKRVLGWDTIANAWGVQSSKLFLYDGWNLIAELDALSANAAVCTYVWGLDLSGSFQGAGGVGGLLLSTLNSQPSTYASAFDGNGNVIGLVDMATGAKSATYDYNAFGETLIADGSAATLFPFRFSTKFTDTETGLLYYGFRYYSPGIGRWPSRDPLGEQGSINMYGFIGNNALNSIDLFGLAAWDCNCPSDIGNKKLENISYNILQGSLESRLENMAGSKGKNGVNFGLGWLVKKVTGSSVYSTPLAKAAKSNYSTYYGGYRGHFEGEYRKCVAGWFGGVKWSVKKDFSGTADGLDGGQTDFYTTPQEALDAAKHKASEAWNAL